MALLDFILPVNFQRRLGWLDAEPQAASFVAPSSSEQPLSSEAAESEPLPPFESEQDLAAQNAAVNQFLASTEAGGLPAIGGGRSSVSETEYGLVPNMFLPVPTDYPFQLLTVLENLSIFNKHLSYAVDNVVTLGATEMDIYFSDKLKQADVRKMRAHLAQASGKWFGFGGNEKTFIADLFAQVATFGVVSAEIVAKKDLSGIEYVTKVPPRKIRFFQSKTTSQLEPYQEVGALNTVGSVAGYKPLNMRTYRYVCVRTWKDSPYPVPPFISAIKDLFIEANMLNSFEIMMQRMGMLGFLSVIVSMPPRDIDNDESLESYQVRLVRHLESLRPQMEKGFSQGLTIGYRGHHKFELQGNQMNSQGAAEMLKIVKSGIFAGLHQDPNMHGENQNTSETFGRVILAKMSAQMASFQNAVASFYEHLILNELLLAGLNPGTVTCVFKSAMIGDQKRDEEVQLLRISNVNTKVDRGYISQEQAAQELGYEQPYLKESPVPAGPPTKANAADRNDGKESTGSGNPSADKKATSNDAARRRAALPALLRGLGAQAPAYDYAVPLSCDPSLSFGDTESNIDSDAVSDDVRLARYQARYQNAVARRFRIALRKTREPLRKSIVALGKDASQQQLQDTVLYHLVRNWQRDFARPVALLATDYVGKVYRRYRRDQSVFTTASGFSRGGSFFSVPDATFGLKDFRAMEYLAKADSFYLGKFVTDPDTRQRLLDFVAREYLGKNNPVGKGQDAITAFIDLYEGQIQLEAYKIRRIAETTAAKARNYANMHYIAQAEVEQFEIVEVDDQRTCDYCRHMNGKVFSTDTTVTKLDKLFLSAPEDVPTLTPFATTIPLDEFKKLSADQLQAKGIHAPTYHSHCRGRVVAVI